MKNRSSRKIFDYISFYSNRDAFIWFYRWHWFVILIGLLLTLISQERTIASGFPQGQLIATDYSGVYAIDLQTGNKQTLWSGQSNFGDVVFNPVTQSAFIIASSNILELTWETEVGFRLRVFLSALTRPEALAVDRDGNLYFNQQLSFYHGIWRATTNGTVTSIVDSSSDLFVVKHFAISPDQSVLYVTTSSGYLVIVPLQGGAVGRLGSRLSFPSGVDVDQSGNIYMTDDQFQEESRVVIMTPTGVANSYAVIPSGSVGILGDLEYDDRSGILYLADSSKLYALSKTGDWRELATVSGLRGIDLILDTETCSTAHFQLGMYAGLRISGDIGCAYRIDYTTALNVPINWIALTNLVLPNDDYLFIDPGSLNDSRRFYRAVHE